MHLPATAILEFNLPTRSPKPVTRSNSDPWKWKIAIHGIVLAAATDSQIKSF